MVLIQNKKPRPYAEFQKGTSRSEAIICNESSPALKNEISQTETTACTKNKDALQKISRSKTITRSE